MEALKLILGIIILSNIVPCLTAYIITYGFFEDFKKEFIFVWTIQIIIFLCACLVFLGLWLTGLI